MYDFFFKTIEEYGVTGFGVVPAAWAYIRKIAASVFKNTIGKFTISK